MPLFSRVQGNPDNTTLVFLHGFLGNTKDWQETIAYLKDDYYCISIDLPGHGRSVPMSLPLQDGFQSCHHLIKKTLNDLQVKQYTFIAYSLGGRIALDYARTQNDKGLQNLILESCHTGLTSQSDKEQRYIHDLGWAKRFATQTMMKSLEQWYEQAIFGNLSDWEKGKLIEKRSHNYGVYLASMLLATSLSKQTDALPFLQSDKIKRQSLPVYYCFGEKDLKFKHLADILSRQTQIQITCFDGAGHNVHQQTPRQYAQFIREKLT
ncbi:MAG: 2-succinyl-6-hydroxy-2,4-cyclohexadiene-1-carboxylate synthase [Psychromonas sp.]|nr:2-succinyl-6-hydroxy-2,4-cyclohexadiene-1-carboxylate synthase [Psychromonas sp.]